MTGSLSCRIETPDHRCPVGCDGGACETCPCCSAGWCVFGLDGLPEDADDFAAWLEIAAAHNPLAAALAAAPAAPPTRSVDADALRDALRTHHPIMRSETGPFSGCRCGQARLGEDVIAHVVGHLRAALAETDAPIPSHPRAEESPAVDIAADEREEAAARAMWESQGVAPWAQLGEEGRDGYRRMARAALAAARPSASADEETDRRIHIAQAGAMASFAEDLEREGESRAAVMADIRAAFYSEWAADPTVIPPEIEDPPAPADDPAAAVERVRALHRPWYEIHGVRHDHTVMANCEDFDGCDGTAERDCDEAGEHERLACVECRHVFEDVDGNLFWPCPTIRALDGS